MNEFTVDSDLVKGLILLQLLLPYGVLRFQTEEINGYESVHLPSAGREIPGLLIRPT